MTFEQARELWNTIAQKKNLSIHHGLKVINGWKKVPVITDDIDSLNCVANFLDEWKKAIQINIDAHHRFIAVKRERDKYHDCQCDWYSTEEQYDTMLREEHPLLYDGVSEKRTAYKCHRCGGLLWLRD